MGKEKRSHQELEQYARGKVRTLFSGWVLNSLEEDFAFDFEVRPRDRWTGSNEVTPNPFYVQLKSSERFDDRDSVWWDLETEYLADDCLRASVPVVLLIYERWNDEFNWCIVQRICWDVLDEHHEGWREQSSVRIKVGRDPIDGEIESIRSAVGGTQRRLSMREYVATSRRPSFEQSPETSLATSDEVTAHKTELLDEAMCLAEEGQAERAREKLLQLYQMPEDDVPTVEAIRQLLDLREMDDPGVAFGKARLARDGYLLAAKFDLEDQQDAFESTYEEAWEYIEEVFIGARYRQRSAPRDLLVLAVSDWGRSDQFGPGAAIVQYGVGELGDEMAEALATNDEYTLVESGADRDPLGDACEERDHDFDTEVLREAPGFAICSRCDLSRQTIQQRLNQDIPSICDRCDDLVYDPVFERDRPYCAECN